MSRADFIKQCREANKDFFAKHPVLLKYKRDSKNRRIGVIVALKQGEVILVGFSKCNVSLEDFDKDIGIQKALARTRRLLDYMNGQVAIPNSMLQDVLFMFDRARRYFKQATP